MAQLSVAERAQRLAEYSRGIVGSAPIEHVFTDMSRDTMDLADESPARIQQARDAVQRALEGRGQELSAQDVIVAEAIIHKTKRPSRLIQDDWFESFSGEFRYLTEDNGVKSRLRNVIPAVGRIDLLERPTTYGGTGFVVGRNLVMTNRHVAEIFVTGVGIKNVTIKPWDPGAVDFKHEWGRDAVRGFNLTKCLMIHPYWDMALFVADLPDGIRPLTLSVTPYTELIGRDVVTIGYPAFDPERNDPDVQQEIFKGKYNVKRIAPGRIANRKQAIHSSWLHQSVEALAHDSSTLGGNSGSAVIDVLDGQVAALHFAGRYLIENYGVPGHELARDPRVVDLGVNFSVPVPSKNHDLDSFWRNADPGEHEDRGDAGRRGRQDDRHKADRPDSRSASGATAGGAVTMEVPLRITVSLGDGPSSTIQATYDRGRGAADDGDDGRESPGGGYDPDFLTESVPTPWLPNHLMADSFSLDGSHLLHYMHFSVCQSKSRRLPRFVAWNIDGGNLKALSRRGIDFRLDNRVPSQFQAGNELYSNNPYDRGHMARRADLTWGPVSEARRANKDSFFFTNITPQNETFNQSGMGGVWGKLENAIMEDVEVEDLRVSVLAGPVFKDDDVEYRSVQIPRNFWKLIAFRDTADDRFKVAAYILGQSVIEALDLNEFRLYHVSLNTLSHETGLSFDELTEFDTFDNTRETLGGRGVREIRRREDIL